MLESLRLNCFLKLLRANIAHCRFASEAGKTSLLRVLRAYAVYDTEVGYCQGMNFLAGLLLTWMPNEATAYAGLVVLMQQRGLRELYKSDLAKLQVTIMSGIASPTVYTRPVGVMIWAVTLQPDVASCQIYAHM